MTRRRTVLRSLAAAAAPFAGCLGGDGGDPTGTPATPSGDGPPDDSPTPTATPTTETPHTDPDGALEVGDTYKSADGWTMTVRDAWTASLVRTTSVGSTTHIDVGCLDEEQFVVVDATTRDPDGRTALTDVDLALEVDGVRYPLRSHQWYWAFPPGSHERPGLPAFAVPVGSASTGSAVWLRDGDPEVRWRLPDDALDALGAAPSFDVRSFDVPEAVSRGSAFEASFTVTNDGDRDGRFVAEFGAGPISDHPEVTVDVPAGGERTVTETLEPHYPEDVEDVEVVLDWGCERLTRSIVVTG